MRPPALCATANHHLMLEEACCVPLVDVQSHGEEEMHTTSYLALRGFGCRLSVASICSTVTSTEVAMLWSVTAMEHSCVAMLVVRQAVILLA